MLRRLRQRRTFWSALALGILAVPTMFAGTAAAPAESQEPLPEPELNPLAVPPPDPAELLTALLRSQTRLIADLAPDEYQMLVVEAAHRHGVDPRLIAAVITVETRWDPTAVGAHGERGLMQILPSTGEWLAGLMGLTGYDLSDPATSVELGTYYLSVLIREHGSPDVALAVYNGGPRAAAAWQSNVYRQKVMAVYNRQPAGEPAREPRAAYHFLYPQELAS